MDVPVTFKLFNSTLNLTEHIQLKGNICVLDTIGDPKVFIKRVQQFMVEDLSAPLSEYINDRFSTFKSSDFEGVI